MAVIFSANPAELFTVCNQTLVYSIHETGALGAGYRFVVWVSEYDDATVTEIAKLYITPNVSDYAHFDLSKIVMKSFSKISTLTKKSLKFSNPHNNKNLLFNLLSTIKFNPNVGILVFEDKL